MNTGSTLGGLAAPLLAFLAVVAMIPLALWLLKRTPIGQAQAGQPVRLVGQLALAPNQRVVTVEVGHGDERRWLVLGVTPAGINTLHSLAPQAAPEAAGGGAAGPGFAQLLARARGAVGGAAMGSGAVGGSAIGGGAVGGVDGGVAK